MKCPNPLSRDGVKLFRLSIVGRLKAQSAGSPPPIDNDAISRIRVIARPACFATTINNGNPEPGIAAPPKQLPNHSKSLISNGRLTPCGLVRGNFAVATGSAKNFSLKNWNPGTQELPYYLHGLFKAKFQAHADAA